MRSTHRLALKGRDAMIANAITWFQGEFLHRIVDEDHSTISAANWDRFQGDYLGHIWAAPSVCLVMPVWFLHRPVLIRKPPGVCSPLELVPKALIKFVWDDLLCHDLIQALLEGQKSVINR
jgi:hypothetical protein